MRSTSFRLLLLALVACDPSARTEARGAGSGDHRSQEHETCARSADCASGLRCFDGTCRRTDQSVLGELHASIGDRALTSGDAAEAAEAYGAAVAQYEKEKLAPPADLLCAQGRAILQERGAAPRRLEIAARLLHRCLLGAPAGSSLRDRALDALATLTEHGLDPALIARAEPADAYLTRKPAAPDPDELGLEVTVQGRSRSRTFERFKKFLQESPEVKASLLGCWKAHFEATRSDRMEVTLSFRYGFALDQYDDFSHSYIKVSDAELPSDEAAAAATTCARDALEPLVDAEGRKMGSETRWDSSATFALSPASGS